MTTEVCFFAVKSKKENVLDRGKNGFLMSRQQQQQQQVSDNLYVVSFSEWSSPRACSICINLSHDSRTIADVLLAVLGDLIPRKVSFISIMSVTVND